MLTIGLIHRSLMTSGFILRRSLPTGTTIMALLVMVVNLWSLMVGEVIRIPWMVLLLFAWFWLVTFGSTCLRPTIPGASLVLWQMKCVNGPLDLREGLTAYWRLTLYMLMLSLQLSCSIALILQSNSIAWQMIWRQGWYASMIAQLISSSPLLAVAFIVGLF